MDGFTDPQFLARSQYRNSDNLDARIAIHKRFSANPYGWFHWMFDAFSTLTENAHVLELGCGSGELWRACAERIPAGWKVTLSFTLENGREQLQEFFPRVELSRYPDSLQVTDVGMILAYIRSMVSAEDLREGELRALERELTERIGKDGEIFIAKDSGLFKAWKH